jgi:hypothetical protein
MLLTLSIILIKIYCHSDIRSGLNPLNLSDIDNKWLAIVCAFILTIINQELYLYVIYLCYLFILQ